MLNVYMGLDLREVRDNDAYYLRLCYYLTTTLLLVCLLGEGLFESVIEEVRVCMCIYIYPN